MVRILLFSVSVKKIIRAHLFKNEHSNHQPVSLRITEHGRILKWSNSLQPGMVLGGLRHMVIGPNLTKVKGNKRYTSVPDCHSLYDSSSQTTNSAWYRQVPHTYTVREALSLRAYNLKV